MAPLSPPRSERCRSVPAGNHSAAWWLRVSGSQTKRLCGGDFPGPAGFAGFGEVAHGAVFHQRLWGGFAGRFPGGHAVSSPPRKHSSAQRFSSDCEENHHGARKKPSQSTPKRPAIKRRPIPMSPRLSSRPLWQGQLRLSLVSCPVALYGATSRSADISFHLLNPETNNRIRMIPTDPTPARGSRRSGQGL